MTLDEDDISFCDDLSLVFPLHWLLLEQFIFALSGTTYEIYIGTAEKKVCFRSVRFETPKFYKYVHILEDTFGRLLCSWEMWKHLFHKLNLSLQVNFGMSEKLSDKVVISKAGGTLIYRVES